MDTSSTCILIVEDDYKQLEFIISILKPKFDSVYGVTDLESALIILEKKAIQVVLTDIHLQNDSTETPDGLALLKHLKMNHPEVMALAMSADPDIKIFDQALAFGALQFLKKPIDGWDDIFISLNLAKRRNILEKRQQAATKKQVLTSLAQKYPDGVILPHAVRRKLESIANHPKVPLIISGETGTGKEECAKIVHRARCLKEGDVPFVAINCALLRAELAHSSLFGHKKGAFTGAAETTTGYIGEADGGILFLDEIHTLPKNCQQDLLRVLNDGTFSRVGDPKILKSNFQIICASTKDLEDEVEKGNVILDLVSRIIGAKIDLPPLRERKDEISDFIQLFFELRNIKVDTKSFNQILDKCKSLYWQGNIRMLYQALSVMQMNSVMDGRGCSVEFMPDLKLMYAPSSDKSMGFADQLIARISNAEISLETGMNAFEKRAIEETVSRCKTISEAAIQLGMSRSNLDLKRKKYNISKP